MSTLTDRDMLVRFWEYHQLTDAEDYTAACEAFQKRWGHDPEQTGEVVVRETRELVLQIQVEAAATDLLEALSDLRQQVQDRILPTAAKAVGAQLWAAELIEMEGVFMAVDAAIAKAEGKA